MQKKSNLLVYQKVAGLCYSCESRNPWFIKDKMDPVLQRDDTYIKGNLILVYVPPKGQLGDVIISLLSDSWEMWFCKISKITWIATGDYTFAKTILIQILDSRLRGNDNTKKQGGTFLFILLAWSSQYLLI